MGNKQNGKGWFRGGRKGMVSYTVPLVLLILVIAGLELFVRLSGISRTILPTPSAIFITFAKNFSRDIWPHLLFSLSVILSGYLISVPLGMGTGALCSQFTFLRKTVPPLIILLVVTPMITMVPLLMVWMGFDVKVRVIAVIVQSTPIIALNTLTGFLKVESSKQELMRSMGASRLQSFFKLNFPNALPQIFTGLKLGCIFSIIAAMSADMAAGKYGLGYKIKQFSSLIMTEMAYGTVILVAIIGILLFQIIVWTERKSIVWSK